MAETNAPPTTAATIALRNDIEDYTAAIGVALSAYITLAVSECKRILEDDRQVPWSRVFDTTNDAYLDNSDETGRNEDRIQNAMSNMAIAMVFRDYAVKQDLEESWTLLADYHEEKAKDRLLNGTLDIDTDDSGTIDSDEEGDTGQVFMVK